MKIDCDLCKTTYPFGNGKYDGKFLSHYQMNICQSCYSTSWDGIAPIYKEKFIEHLTSKNIALPLFNEKGFFPRD